MFGVILISIGTFFEEISASIGKFEMSKKVQDIYVYGFLMNFAGMVIFMAMFWFDHKIFQFSMESIPYLLIRFILEIASMYSTLMAISKADRSSFSFIRTGTIPLLLIVDLVLGYQLKEFQLIGIVLLIFILGFICLRNKIDKKGLKYMIFSTIIPVATISLYKYDITHFNSVAAEQMIIIFGLLIFLSFVLIFKVKQNPFKLLKKPVFILQSLTHGLAIVLEGYAYMFDAASVLIAAKRAATVLWSTLSGIEFFGEKKARTKFFLALVLISILVMLI